MRHKMEDVHLGKRDQEAVISGRLPQFSES